MRSLARSQDLKSAGVVNAAEALRRKATVEAREGAHGPLVQEVLVCVPKAR
jgi:hypothetical protein